MLTKYAGKAEIVLLLGFFFLFYVALYLYCFNKLAVSSVNIVSAISLNGTAHQETFQKSLENLHGEDIAIWLPDFFLPPFKVTAISPTFPCSIKILMKH